MPIAAVKFAEDIALYIGCVWNVLPGVVPCSICLLESVWCSGTNTSSTTIVLLPVPLSPTVNQSSTMRKSSRGISSQRRSGSSAPSRLMGTAAVSQLQWSTPLEKKPRPVQRYPPSTGTTSPTVLTTDEASVFGFAHSSSCVSGGNNASNHMWAVHNMCTQPVDGHADASSIVT